MKRIKRRKFEQVPVTYDLDVFMQDIPQSGPKILHLDIESSRVLAYVWGCNKQFVAPADIVQDWNLLSFAAKWHRTGHILYQSLRSQRRPTNDFSLCKSLHKILNAADVVVAHNGKRFDMRKIRARMAHNRMPPIKDIRIIDTLIESRKAFGFTSQRLGYLTEHFGDDGMRKNSHGKFPGNALWHAVMVGIQEAWDEMEEYNIPDVLSMEGMFDELRPWFQGAQNLAIFTEAFEEGAHHCPNCGSHNVKKDGVRRTQVSIFQQYKCKDCGAYSRGRKNIANTSHVLVN